MSVWRRQIANLLVVCTDVCESFYLFTMMLVSNTKKRRVLEGILKNSSFPAFLKLSKIKMLRKCYRMQSGRQ